MLGLAQKKYLEEHGSLPFQVTPCPWGRLDAWLDAGALEHIEVEMARHFLGAPAKETENLAAFICYLTRASMQGHLAVKCEEMLTPDPLTLFPEIPEILPMIELGKELPDHPALVKEGAFVYFARHYKDEQKIKLEMHRLMDAPPAFAIDLDEIASEINALSLLEEQREAIFCALRSSLTCITGGPGTGKTTTAGHLIRLLMSRYPLKIALAAPTGKAALHLQQVLGLENVKATTLHALLKTPGKLAYDLILVDESSMIDVNLMAALLASVKTGARLVLLGDKHQLPPVESGSLFADLVRCQPSVIELKRCMRTELRSILEFAESVKLGRVDQALAAPVERRTLEAPSEVLKKVTPLFEAEKSFCLLTPLRKGPFGVEAMNRHFLEHFLQKWDQTHPFHAPILITANDKRLELANGEVGTLVRREGLTPSLEDYALFGERKINASFLNRFEYAWALSVHKAQGSEFDHVIVLLPEGSEVFGRELLYTAATRARKRLEIWGDERVIRQMIDRVSVRVSGF